MKSPINTCVNFNNRFDNDASNDSYNVSDQWVFDNIFEAIYLNDQMSKFDIPCFRKIKNKKIKLILPEAPPLQVKNTKENIVEKILNIMLLKSVRRGTKGLIKPFLDPIKQKIKIFVEHNQPISFVLPTLPFKDQSPFGTMADIDHTDLGEYCLFAQLKRIVQAIKSIYHPGAHITLLCDGYIYADIFVNNDKDGAGRYKAKCEKIKNAYKLYNDVTLLDMREVFFNIPSWAILEKKITNIIWKHYKNDINTKLRIDFLARRFVYYVALPDHTYETAKILYSNVQWPNWVWEVLLNSAIKYAAIHLTMRKTNLITKVFPYSIRCTVHPKPAAQLPLHLTNSKAQLLPYNGVAVVSREALKQGLSLFQALRVRRFYEILKNEDVYAVYTNNASHPFYYEIP